MGILESLASAVEGRKRFTQNPSLGCLEGGGRRKGGEEGGRGGGGGEGRAKGRGEEEGEKVGAEGQGREEGEESMSLQHGLQTCDPNLVGVSDGEEGETGSAQQFLAEEKLWLEQLHRERIHHILITESPNQQTTPTIISLDSP